jgi:hypothetical protein
MAWYNKGTAFKLLSKIPESNAAFAKAKWLGYKGEFQFFGGLGRGNLISNLQPMPGST